MYAQTFLLYCSFLYVCNVFTIQMWSEHSGFTYSIGETDEDIIADIVLEFAQLSTIMMESGEILISLGDGKIDRTDDNEQYGVIKLNSDPSIKWNNSDGNTLNKIALSCLSKRSGRLHHC